MNIDFDKPIQTRCGYPVEIWTTEAKDSGDFPVRGQYYHEGYWGYCKWGLSGNVADFDKELNLINPPEEIEGWVNIYPYDNTGTHCIWPTLKAARSGRTKSCIACIKIKFKEGDGL